MAEPPPLSPRLVIKIPEGEGFRLRGSRGTGRVYKRTTPIESLLGWDVLQHFRIVIDWSQHEVSLEQPPAPVP
jgi:hypothetical protein